MQRFFTSIFVRLVRNLRIQNQELSSETSGSKKLPVVSLSKSWISVVNEFQMLHLNKNLPLIFHPGFNRKDGVVVYVHEINLYEVVCTKLGLCHKTKRKTNKNNHCFVVVRMYISSSLKTSLILKELRLSLIDFYTFLGYPISFAGESNIDFLIQNKLSSI